MTSLEKVKFVTEQYYELQGLRWVIWGVVCFAIALEELGTIPKLWFLVIILPVGLVGFIGITGYYLRRYGLVVGAKRGWSNWVWNFVALLVLFVGFAADKWLGTRPFVMPLMFALWFLLQFWLVGRQWRAYYLWIALALSAANLAIGFTKWPIGSPLLVQGFVTWMLVGCAMIIGGALDHRLLAQTLGGKVAEDVGTV